MKPFNIENVYRIKGKKKKIEEDEYKDLRAKNKFINNDNKEDIILICPRKSSLSPAEDFLQNNNVEKFSLDENEKKKKFLLILKLIC